MKMCIIHFASSLLRILLANKYYWCYLDAVFTIFYRIQFSTKKIYCPFTQDQYIFQKIKSYGWWSAEKQTVKFYLVPGVRNGNIYLMPNDSYEKFYLAVNGLTPIGFKCYFFTLMWTRTLLQPYSLVLTVLYFCKSSLFRDHRSHPHLAKLPTLIF